MLCGLGGQNSKQLFHQQLHVELDKDFLTPARSVTFKSSYRNFHLHLVKNMGNSPENRGQQTGHKMLLPESVDTIKWKQALVYPIKMSVVLTVVKKKSNCEVPEM